MNTQSPPTKKILIMDDEEIVLEVATMMLQHLGYAVAVSRDGKEMLTKYQQAREQNDPFAMVILDLSIPGGMGGKEAVTTLLSKDPQARAVVSSGDSQDPIMQNFQEYGFSGALGKPFRLEELETAIMQVLANQA